MYRLLGCLGLFLSLLAGVCGLHAADSSSLPSKATSAGQETYVPMPELLPLRVFSILGRTTEPVILVERTEKVGTASFIRSKSGQLKTLVPDAVMVETDTILVGQRNQFYGRFGDGSLLSLSPFSVMEITQRKQVGDNAIDTLLSLYQGAIRVRVPPMAAQGAFLIRLPNVKEGPVTVAGPGHVYLFPTNIDLKERTLDLDVVVFSGEPDVSFPFNKTATGDTNVTLNDLKTVKVPAGMFIRLAFLFEPMKEPVFGGPVYMLHLELTKSDMDPKPHSFPTPEDNDAPPRIVPLNNPADSPTPPPPPPPVSGGG